MDSMMMSPLTDSEIKDFLNDMGIFTFFCINSLDPHKKYQRNKRALLKDYNEKGEAIINEIKKEIKQNFWR